MCSNTTNIVPRLAEPNGRIPAYVDMLPAWGSKPVAVGTFPARGTSPVIVKCMSAIALHSLCSVEP